MVSIEMLIGTAVVGLLVGCIYALGGLGLAFIYGILDFVNFGHGDFPLMLSMYVTFWLFVIFGLDPIFSPILAVPLFFLFGIFVYKLVAKRTMKGPALSQIAATIGLMIMVRGLAQVAWSSDPRSIPFTIVRGSIEIGGLLLPQSRIVGALISIGAFILIHYFLNRTYTGLCIRAITDDRVATEILGINTERLYMLSFGIGISLTSIAGAVMMTYSFVDPTIGLRYGLLLFVILCLAGLGTIKGVIFAGCILGVIEALTTVIWESRAAMLVVFIIFILMLWLRPKGLWGRR